MAAEDIAAGSAGAAVAAQQQSRQQRREGSSDREMICINHPGFDRLREFCFREDLGLVTRMRDLSDSFGKFHGSSGSYKRSVLHPSGKLCTLYENAEAADDDGSCILWGGSAAVSLLLTASRHKFLSVGTSACCDDKALTVATVILSDICKSSKNALIELGAGHGLPCALAALSGVPVLATDTQAKQESLVQSLTGLLGCTTEDARHMSTTLSWGNAADARAAAAHFHSLSMSVGCVLGCDVVYKAAHVEMLSDTVLQIVEECAAQQATAPNVLFVVDPACVPGCTSLLSELFGVLHRQLKSSHSVHLGACSDDLEHEASTVLLLCAKPL